MRVKRDANHYLVGDIACNNGFPMTVLSDISPIVFSCSTCKTFTMHVITEHPTGIAFKLPFARKPLASSSREWLLICNECADAPEMIFYDDDVVKKMRNKVIPTEITNRIEKSLKKTPDAPDAYGEGFVNYMKTLLTERDGKCPGDYLLLLLSIYKRE